MRKGKVERITKETKRSCEVNLDGIGLSKISEILTTYSFDNYNNTTVQ